MSRLAKWWDNSALMVVTAGVVLAELAFCLVPIWV